MPIAPMPSRAVPNPDLRAFRAQSRYPNDCGPRLIRPLTLARPMA